jgi:hypothetical protein
MGGRGWRSEGGVTVKDVTHGLLEIKSLHRYDIKHQLLIRAQYN